MTTLLHVEDDPGLTELVQLSFEIFGFRGTALSAQTVQAAREILGDTVHHPRIDLVVSDMRLPDGSGLDVVRSVRTDPMRARVPILILSGETDHVMIDRAYALGANSYVAKGTSTRSMPEVMRSLYDHWLRDALLPSNVPSSRTRAILARAVAVRARAAELFANVSKMFDAEPVHAAFWMTLALRHGNVANLMTFLGEQLDGRELSDAFVDRLALLHDGEVTLLNALERDLAAHPERTAVIARDGVVELLCHFDPDNFVQVTSQLFPVVQAAVTSMREVVVRALEDVLMWMEAQRDVGEDQLARMRTVIAKLRILLDA